MFKHFIAGLSLAAILSGCATIFSQSDPEHFDISSDPTAAKISITDLTTNNVVIDNITPLKIDLEKYNGYFSGKSY